MTMLFLQTLLMMLAGYFVGAALACCLRKMIAPAQRSAPRIESPARSVEPLPEMARGALVTSETVSRFEKALGTPEPARPAPPVVAPPPPRVAQPVPTPIAAPDPVAPPNPAPVAVPERAHTHAHAPVEAPHPAPPTEIIVPPPPRISLTTPPVAAPLPRAVEPVRTEAVTATLAAAATAMASAAAVTARSTSDTANVAPLSGTPVSGTAATTVVGDDLTRIRGINKPIADSLRAKGVTRYAQIAAWMRPDVTRVNQDHGFKARVERENWIEQAQILANRGDTLFSRHLRGAVTTVQPNLGQPSGVQPSGVQPTSARPVTAAATLSPAVAQAAPSPQAATLAAATVAAAAAAAGHTARMTPTASSDLPRPVAVAPHVEERAAFAQPRPPATPAVVVTPTPPLPAAPAPVAPAAPVAVSTAAVSTAAATAYQPPLPPAQPLRPAASPNRDGLQRISGVNAEIEKLLNVQGVTRFAQVAGWSQVEIDRFDRLLGAPGRVRRESWIEQAQMLMKGGDTSGARVPTGALQAMPTIVPATAPVTSAVTAAAAAVAATAAAVARPTRLTDAIHAQQMQPPVASTVPAPARSDLSGLRSVKSEAFQPGALVRGGAIDDLKRIRGVGVLIEKRLNALGITGYEQIAHWTADDIARFSQQLDFKGRIERENWVEQARILASGGFTEFSRRVDRGEVETSKPRV